MDSISNWAVLDSGATSNFLMTSAPVSNVQRTINPIVACLPNSEWVQSTHTCMLDLPNLPTTARLANIIPGLASHSLISMVMLCNEGCKVLFTKIGCSNKYHGHTILCSSKCMRTGLWMIPHQPIQPPMIPPTNGLPPMAMAANVAATSTAGNYAHFLHQALCSPPTPSLLRALARSTELKTFPSLTPHLIIHHLPPSTATIKATCNNTAKAYNLRRPINQPSYKLMPKLITLYLLKKSALPTTCFALRHWPTYTPGQCTLMAPVHSRCACFGICDTCL
jgi:hypothetical protein